MFGGKCWEITCKKDYKRHPIQNHVDYQAGKTYRIKDKLGRYLEIVGEGCLYQVSFSDQFEYFDMEKYLAENGKED